MPRKLVIAIAATWLPIITLTLLVLFSERETAADPSIVQSVPPSVVTRSPPNRVAKNIDFAIDSLRFNESRTHLSIEPLELKMDDVKPHLGGEASVLVYSSHWTNFSIRDVQCSMPELTWTIEPAEIKSLDALKASAGYRLNIRVPPDLKNGRLKAALTVTAMNEESGESRSYEVPVSGRVLRRLSVYGEKINRDAVVDLGVSFSGHRETTRLLMKVRDEQLALAVRKVIADPDFLEVEVSPGRKEGDYFLDIAIPENAKPGNWTNGNLGKIRIEFDHPRIADLELKAFFSVTDKSPYYDPPFLATEKK